MEIKDSLAAVAEVAVMAGFLSFVISLLVDAAAKPMKEKFPNWGGWSLVLMYSSWLLSGLVVYSTKIDLLSPLFPNMPSWLSLLLSAAVAGRGSNFIHDVFAYFDVQKNFTKANWLDLINSGLLNECALSNSLAATKTKKSIADDLKDAMRK